MDTNKALVRAIEPTLLEVDSVLAASAVLLPDRPLAAALLLVEYELVKAVDQSGHPVYGPDSSGHFGMTPWFKALHRAVESWYRDQYGRAMYRLPQTGVRGAVLIRGTGFEVRIPTTRVRPAEPGETIWLTFLDRVENDEVVFDWLAMPPNLDRLGKQSREQADSDIRAIANALRAITINLMGVAKPKDDLRGFLRSVRTHLEMAAKLAISTEMANIKAAWWELQMVLEACLKALTLAKSGTYLKIHKVSDLLTAAAQIDEFTFDATRFDAWPSPSEICDLRYAQGPRSSHPAIFDAYRLILDLAVAATKPMPSIRLGGASFKLRRPPWLDDDEGEVSASAA